MARRRYRFPITSHMVRQSRHDVMVRAAENKADSGGTNLRIKRSVVIESSGVVEKNMQLELEEWLESKGRGGERVTVRIEDMGVDADVLRSRLDAAGEIRLSARAVREVAGKCGLPALTEWLDAGGEQRVNASMGQRHGFVHSLSHEEPDDVGACDTAEGVSLAALDGRPIDRSSYKLVEGSLMEMAGRPGDARAAYEMALADSRGCKGGGPDGARALVCSGHALAHLERPEEAEAALWDAARADPGSPLAHLELGHLALLAGRYADADGMYARAIEIDPSYAPARVFRGHALSMRDGPGGRRAVVQYDGGLALDPYNVSAHVGRGLAKAGLGLHAEAVAHFEEALRIDPDDAASYVALGHALAALGRDAEAAGAYESAIEMGAGIGPVRSASGRGVDRAIRLRYRLGGASAYLGLAGTLSRMGRHERALALYREAAELDGGSAEAHAGAARMLALLGRWEEAIPEYRRASERDPHSAESNRGLGNALLNLGRFEEAILNYRRAIDLDPHSARAHLILAGALSKLGRFEEAAPAYRAASELDPHSARAHMGLAEALSKLGRFEEAAPAYRAASELDPHNARAHMGLADSLAMTGMTTEAQRAYERAVELDPGIKRGRYRSTGEWGA